MSDQRLCIICPKTEPKLVMQPRSSMLDVGLPAPKPCSRILCAVEWRHRQLCNSSHHIFYV